ncbi:GntR family transcriptional regulator [Rhizobium lusitanum]|uniref:GntR family transcriptional regulator n=1 Tax=Rhizobium lusitanum TaxID=293958 RepID=UPI00157366EE|nr:GntR family transcriptional regulator [Rhizobium lusitanum]NTJ11568.1 GntR family transcriptional regulator [Rhizobium lusitanum]
MLADKHDADPKNQRIFKILRERILSHEYDDSGSLPPELTLMEEFEVSRYTVRAALQKLVTEGFIERRRGSGTTIIQRTPAEATWSAGSLDMMISKSYETEMISASYVPASDYPDIAKSMGVAMDKRLFRLITIMRNDGQPIIHSTLLSREEYAARVPGDIIGKGFFVNQAEEFAGVRSVRARQVTSAIIPPFDAAAKLELAPGQPVLLLNRGFYSAGGEVLHHVIMCVRPDTHPQIVNFYRQDEMQRRF